LVDQFSFLGPPDAKRLPQRRTLSVLDRTGDIELAAKTIATSRISPSCISPYSPDLVLVNEFVKENFTERCLKHARDIGRTPMARNGTVEEQEFQKLLEEAEAKGEIAIHHSKGAYLSVVEVKER
jgi:hypothetical protein